MKLPRIILAAAALAIGLATGGAVWFVADDESRRPAALPSDDPSRGLVHDGLERADTGRCKGGFVAVTTGRCTHGPDPAPPEVDPKIAVPPIIRVSEPTALVQCDGDGASGNRVQVIYARASDREDRHGELLDSIRQWAADADKIYRDSAAETGGERHIRFVHTAACAVDVDKVTLSPSGDDNFDLTQAELLAAGYDREDRKYLVFVDATVYCGIAGFENDDSPSSNANDTGPSFARIDSGCWNGDVAAHELMHTLGGVQQSAPHAGNSGHCVDEYDLVCESHYPGEAEYLCADRAHDRRFDCNHNDYFHTSPARGGYLDTHWNAANSSFLVSESQSLWGYVLADRPTAASYTPITRYQRNSTGATNTIERTGVGAYTVTFPNLGFAAGTNAGTVDVTPYGIFAHACRVARWFRSLADLVVEVRCNGDTQFTAAYARPISASRFGYVLADPNSPSATHHFNSTGGTNTIALLPNGTFEVRFPGLGAPGGTVEVTEYGASFGHRCVIVNWFPSGTDQIVRVDCFDWRGVISTNGRFTMTFSGSRGLLGVLTDSSAERAYVWATRPSAASYTPPYQFNSSGGANTITRTNAGEYEVRLPGLAVDRGHVQVSATGTTPALCKVAWWVASGADELVNVRCFDGVTPADARFVLNFVD